jgi:hypothetical protein
VRNAAKTIVETKVFVQTLSKPFFSVICLFSLYTSVWVRIRVYGVHGDCCTTVMIVMHRKVRTFMEFSFVAAQVTYLNLLKIR